MDNFKVSGEGNLHSIQIDLLIEILAHQLTTEKMVKTILAKQGELKENFESIYQEELEGCRSSISDNIFAHFGNLDLKDLFGKK